MAQWVHHVSTEVDAQSRYPTIIAVAMALTAVMTIIVLTRGYVRLVIVQQLGKDDYVTFFSALVSMVYNGLAVWQTRMGLGLPLTLRPEEDAAQIFVVNFATRPLYMLGVTGYKVALCLAYLRILNNTQLVFRKITWGVLAFILISHLASTLVIILQCNPVAKSWRPEIDGTCLDTYETWNATAAVTIACDIIVFTLPVPIFWSLQMSTRRKIGLMILFLLGLFTTVCSVVRMIQIKQVKETGDNSNLVLYGTIELNVGISLSCAAAIKPLFERWLHSAQSAMSAYSTGSTDPKHNTAVQLRTLPQASAGIESEEDMLPLRSPEGNPRYITKTVEWGVQRQDIAGTSYRRAEN